MGNTHLTDKEKGASKELLLLFACDPWKSTDSMKLVSACTTPDLLRDAVIRALDEGYMKYGYQTDTATAQEMMEEFKNDWKLREVNSVNDRLWCGFIDKVEDGADYGA